MPNEPRRIDDITLKIQALADNELPEEEIQTVMTAIQGSHEYRAEYVEMLRLKKRLAGEAVPELTEEWVDKLERRITRRAGRFSGNLLFIGSYVVLLGYSVYSLFRDSDVPLLVSILVGAGIVGFLLLLGGAIVDRIRESRTDRRPEPPPV